jgi:hypothetical protein
LWLQREWGGSKPIHGGGYKIWFIVSNQAAIIHFQLSIVNCPSAHFLYLATMFCIGAPPGKPYRSRFGATLPVWQAGRPVPIKANWPNWRKLSEAQLVPINSTGLQPVNTLAPPNPTGL